MVHKMKKGWFGEESAHRKAAKLAWSRSAHNKLTHAKKHKTVKAKKRKK
jgi:hypothetical protein